MPKDASALCAGFTGHLRYLDMTRKKMERLYLKRDIVRRDIEQVYAGLFMDTLTTFEQLIEDLFLGLLSGRFAMQQQTVIPLMAFRNKQAIRPAVYNGRRYVDWLPYDRTEERAEIFFRAGGPFANLNATDKKFIDQCSVVRNAIAHRSRHAKNRFEREILSQHTTLMTPERNPTGYLRGVYQGTARTRYEYYASELGSVARKICS